MKNKAASVGMKRSLSTRVHRAFVALALATSAALFAADHASAEVKFRGVNYQLLSSSPGGSTTYAHVHIGASSQLQNIQVWHYYTIGGWKLFQTLSATQSPDPAGVQFAAARGYSYPDYRSTFISAKLELPNLNTGQCTSLWVNGTNPTTGQYEYFQGNCNL